MKKIKRILFATAIVCIMFFFGTDCAFAENEPNYLTFTALEDGSVIQFSWCTGSNVQYKLNNGSWENYPQYKFINLSKNDVIYFKGKNVCTDGSNHFDMRGKIAANGSVTSLTDENGSDPYVTLPEECYSYMFAECKSLVSAPELPALNLTDSCYEYMFLRCSSLTEAPKLPATELAEYCYSCMFTSCYSLKKAPQLPATIMKYRCYYTMFYWCSELEEIPVLPATDLAEGCYESMFGSCAKLLISKEKIPDKFITTEYILPDSEETNCYKGMFYDAGSESEIPSELFPNSTPTAGTYYVLTNEFNIQYNLDGGTNAASNPSSYKFGTGVASFATPTKAGYKFDGWYTDAGFTKKITSISKDAREDYTLYAKWIKERVANTITVKDVNKDIKSSVQKIKLGAKVKGGAKLTYKSNNKKVKVDNKGTVTIPKNFCGTVKITITSAETDAYLKATATSTITVTSAKPKISKVSASKKALTLKWGKVKNADGYEITYSTDKNFAKAKKITAKKTATSTTIKKLTSKKKYYVRMRSYKKSGSKKIYSQYSAVKSIKVK